jgi:hypothetical protein
VHRDHFSLSQQRFDDRANQRGLAGLPRRVENEVMLSLDQLAQRRQALLWRQHVVPIGAARAGGVEETHASV